jgi:uncharacterized membrane protein/thiol-disulfide isomerase/thioredoxin
MKHRFCIISLSLTIITVLFIPISAAQAEEPVVHALLFFSPSCPHCHKVITEDLPPILEQFSDQLLIVGIDTYTEQGHKLYEAIVNTYQIPPERLGVPTMVVGESILVGSLEIPEHFPNIIEDGLATGGIGWPDIPEVLKLLTNEGISDSNETTEGVESGDLPENKPVYDDASNADIDNMVQEDSVDEKANGDEVNDKVKNSSSDEHVEGAEVPEEALLPEDMRSEDGSPGISTSLEEAVLAADQSILKERFARDKTGNTVSIIVLFGMIFSVIGVGVRVSHRSIKIKSWPSWVIPVILFVGIVVAVYMSYVEVTQTEAICGPVGDCNTVQQSSYASLFGIIPIGIFGVAGYLAIGFVWLISVFGHKKWRKLSSLTIWVLSLFGALFSIYLTFLEPFVIGATCAWCLTSAIAMGLLLWTSTAPAIKVWNEYRPIRM